MGYKKVCFYCKKTFNIPKGSKEIINLSCLNCGNKMSILNHKFRPPKRSDTKQWQLVEFLKNNGFIYQHVFEEAEGGGYKNVPYPNNLIEAKEFV